MLKSLIVVLPMVLGAVLAREAHSETVVVSQVASPPAVSRLELPTVSGSVSHNLTFIGGGLGEASSHLPEPAAWGMLLVGFGATGALLRRRRAALIAG